MDIHWTYDWPKYVHAWLHSLYIASTKNNDPVAFQFIVAFITQGFYNYRLGVLTQSKYAVVLIALVRTIDESI